MGTIRIVFSGACALLVLVAPVTSAQQSNLQTSVQSPWVQGVTSEEQQVATDLFVEGNSYLQKALFVKAAEFYREALQHWNHPAIHYNLSLALLDTGLLLELREHLVEAIRYGEGPLDREMLDQALRLKGLVEKQIVQIEVSCDVPGALVKMDGKVLFTAPGSFEGWAMPGPHVFLATLKGFPPNERIRTPGAGEKVTLHISTLYGDDDLTQSRRKWAAWKPWTVLGAGVALVAGGGFLHQQARSNFQEFDRRAEACELRGCVPSPELDSLRRRGDAFQKVAIGAYAFGGALSLTGAVLAVINRAQPYRLTPEEYEQAMSTALQVGGAPGEVRLTFRF